MGLSTLVGNLVDPDLRNDWDEIVRNADGNKALLEYIDQVENEQGDNYKTNNSGRSH